ncbi:cytochrome P450 [Polychytrium aggregatum]|uniref:cytochrome P450 n=1 Tax=Polychytrium aggregatum TaxID=110093 RepID=UPI0022FE6DFB|nr:cytochrome P450 [Polychytrium aggregatum]KAI9209137.1 cytochrome P450 [Polychytrium aggregatum]
MAITWSSSYALPLAIAGAIAAYMVLRRPRHLPDIPGDYQWPLVGNLPYLLPFSRKSKSHLYMRRCMQLYGKVDQGYIFGNVFVNFSDANVVRELLRQDENGAIVRGDIVQKAFRGVGNWILFLMPMDRHWKRHRKMIQPGFGPAQLRRTAVSTNEFLDTLLEHWISTDASVVDFHTIASAVIMDILGDVGFSYRFNMVKHLDDPEKLNEIFQPFDRLFRISFERSRYPAFLWEWFNLGDDQIKPHIGALHTLVLAVLNERRAAEASVLKAEARDIVGRLICVDDEGSEQFTDEEICDELLGFFFAGHETTANTLTFVVAELAQNPAVAERLYNEIHSILGSDGIPSHDQLSDFKYLDKVLKETQRLHSVVPIILRFAVRDTTVAGYKIPKGAHIGISIDHIHHNPEYWKDPDVFNPDRWDEPIVPGSFIPFGDGPMNCIGQKMAVIESKIFVIRLVQKFRLHIVNPDQLDPIYSITLGYKNGLDIRLERR